MARPGRPVVFVHGLWKSSAIWTRWIDRFESEGYRAAAPLWPGERSTVEETRQHPEGFEGVLLSDAVAHVEAQVAEFDELPILVGHSFGALIVEKMLAAGKATAAVAIDPAQSGNALPGSLERLRHIDARFGLDPLGSAVIALTVDQFHSAFCVDASDEEAQMYYDMYYIPSSVNPLLEATLDGFRLIRERAAESAGPLLLVPTIRSSADGADSEDPSIPAFRDSISVEQNSEFLGFAHSLVFDTHWERVADVVLDWLEAKGLRH